MQTETHTDHSTVVVVGADSRRGLEWLSTRFPAAPRHRRALVLRLHHAELDAVLWAEALRLEARRDGVRVSIGLAEQATGTATRDTARAAGHAFERAFSLGGDITLAHSNLLRAA